MACRGFTRDGRRCGFRTKGILCINHDPTQNPKLASEKAAEASRMARAQRTKPVELLATVMSLTDRVSIQATLDAVMRLYLAGHLTHEQYRAMVEGCSVATRNFDRAKDVSEGGRAGHEWNQYFGKVKSLLETAGPVLARDDGPDGED